MKNHLQAIITVLSLINPVICATMFLTIERGRSKREQVADATKAAFAVLVILVLAALGGQAVLRQFGVSLAAFSVAGGGVLVWMGFSMLKSGASDSSLSPDGASAANGSITRMILFAASPGTITGVITISIAHTPSGFPATALVAVTVATFVMWVTIVLVSRLRNGGSGGFVRHALTGFMGLIVVAMGVQFALSGIQTFFAMGS